MPYCGNCGTANNPEFKFCQNCGAPLVQQQQVQPTNGMPLPPPPPSYQPTTNVPVQAPLQGGYGEGVVGVMLLRKPKSMGRYDTFTGVVTTQRMIFAQMTSEMINNAIKAARDQAKSEGRGFWGQWEEQLRASFGYTQRYLNMDPNAALAETPGNFFVSNADIREVKVNLKDLHRQGDTIQRHEFELEVHFAQGKYEFKMDKNDDYVNLLKQVYGERLRMPFGYFSSGGFTIRL